VSEEPSTPAMGERRRRRERERARERAQGLEQPMSRRERRALEEALATGEVELTPDGQYAPTGELPVTTTGQHVLVDPDAPAPAEAEPAGEDKPAQEESPEEPAHEKVVEGEAAEGEAAEEKPARVTRRSLRQKRTNAPSLPQSPAERTATGRRPVIRPPASARSTRSVDATGELTSIQRAIRDVNSEPGQSETWAVPVQSEPERLEADESPEVEDSPKPVEQAESDEQADAEAGERETELAAEESHEAQVTAQECAADSEESAAEDADEDPEGAEEDIDDEVDDRFDMKPRWERLDSVAASPQAPETEEAAQDDPEEPEVAESPEAEPEDVEEEERHTPRLLQLLYWLVLVLAGVVLGLLVWRMATGDLFGADDALALAGSLTGAATG